MKERRKLLYKHELCKKGKFILRRLRGKGKFVLEIYKEIEKLILWISGSKTRSFATLEIGKKVIFT